MNTQGIPNQIMAMIAAVSGSTAAYRTAMSEPMIRTPSIKQKKDKIVPKRTTPPVASTAAQSSVPAPSAQGGRIKNITMPPSIMPQPLTRKVSNLWSIRLGSRE